MCLWLERGRVRPEAGRLPREALTGGLDAPTRSAVGARTLFRPVRALSRPVSSLIKQPLQLPTVRQESLLAGLRPLVAINFLVTPVMVIWGGFDDLLCFYLRRWSSSKVTDPDQ